MKWTETFNNVPSYSLDARPDGDTWLSIQKSDAKDRWLYFSVSAGIHSSGGDIEECRQNLLAFVERKLTEKLTLVRGLMAEGDE